MSETKLEKARAYEEAAGSKVPADLRPRYHLSSRCGWMNDPNGFSFYGGKYHMFYQYYPYDNKWGPMHWAHASRRDRCPARRKDWPTMGMHRPSRQTSCTDTRKQ